jgi:hypothetical protein
LDNIEIHETVEFDRARRGFPLPPVVVEVKARNGQEVDTFAVHSEINPFQVDPLRLWPAIEAPKQRWNTVLVGEDP